MLQHYDGVLSGDIWSQVQSGDDAWKQAMIEFEADGPLQVNWILTLVIAQHNVPIIRIILYKDIQTLYLMAYNLDLYSVCLLSFVSLYS